MPSNSTKTALVIVFNHRYDNNIRPLREIYSSRFSHIYFVVPFYDGNEADVIPVYGNSYYYSTYLAQAARSFHDDQYTHYFFVADDMILNPEVNEHNLTELLNCEADDCFIPEIKTLHQVHDRWNVDYAMQFNIKTWGIEASKELPTYEEALRHFTRHNIEIKALPEAQVFEAETMQQKAKRLVKVAMGKASKRKEYYDLPYPQATGLSDILLVSKQAINKFIHYCGVFGSLGLFVELAIPTALVLAATSIRFEKDLLLQGRYLWTKEELSVLEKYNHDLTKLLSDFPEGYLFIHPVKISKWKTS